MSTPSGSIGVAILGYGAIATLHADALRAAGASLLQVAGPDPKEVSSFASRHGIRNVARSVESAVLADGVEAVVVASPSPVHAEQARMALEAGRHVLVEIPLALSLSEADALVGFAEARGLILGVCHTLRFWDPFIRVRDVLATTGRAPRLIVARSLQRRHANVGWTGRPRSWTDDLLWHHGGHVIDLCLELLRSPVRQVRAVAGPPVAGSPKPMGYAISLATEAGGIASIALSYDALLEAADYVIVLEDDTLLIDRARVSTSRGLLLEVDEREAERQAIQNQDAAFLHAIAGGPAFGASARSIMPTISVQESVARGDGRPG